MIEALIGGVIGSVGGLLAALIVARNNDWREKRDALSLVGIELTKYMSLVDSLKRTVPGDPSNLSNDDLQKHAWVVVQRPTIGEYVKPAIATAVSVDDTLTSYLLHLGLLTADLAETELAEVERIVRYWREGKDWSRTDLLKHLKNGRDFASEAADAFSLAAGRSDAILKSMTPTALLL